MGSVNFAKHIDRENIELCFNSRQYYIDDQRNRYHDTFEHKNCVRAISSSFNQAIAARLREKVQNLPRYSRICLWRKMIPNKITKE